MARKKKSLPPKEDALPETIVPDPEIGIASDSESESESESEESSSEVIILNSS